MKNFFCFKEGANFSLKLDKNCPTTISKGNKFTRTLCIKGANASGKTHALKGLSYLGWFCASSFIAKPEAPIGVIPFFSSKKPVELYAEFSVGDVTYLYELSIVKNEVKRETIYKTIERRKKILERKNNEITLLSEELGRLKTINLRKNASVISTAHQYEFNELNDVYSFFTNIISNVNFGGLNENDLDINVVSKIMESDDSLRKFINLFIANCDTGVSEIEIRKTKTEDGTDEFYPVFIHESDGKKHGISRLTESSGTKMLFRELPRYKHALDTGGVLILDEFDRHLHPHILPKLIDLFEEPGINLHNAQFIFTTHDSEILNQQGRYKTYLVNKENNACFTYRLDEIPGDVLRNDRPILPAYNDGKIGGVPKL